MWWLNRDEEALDEARQAAKLDPFNTLTQGLYGQFLNMAGLFEEAGFTSVTTQSFSAGALAGEALVAGAIFLLLTGARVRERLMHALPDHLKYSIAAGIGLFITFIGLRNLGLITGDPDTLVTLGHLNAPVLLGLAGLLLVFGYTIWFTRDPYLCLIAPGLGFGPFMVMGTHFVLTGNYAWTAFIASLIPFFLVSNLLLLNQFPDVDRLS